MYGFGLIAKLDNNFLKLDDQTKILKILIIFRMPNLGDIMLKGLCVFLGVPEIMTDSRKHNTA